MSAPAAWSLSWCEDGELAPQDRFDLLQTLVASEAVEFQPALIAAVERLSIADLSVLGSSETTSLCV